MNCKFTSASQKDNGKVTFALSQTYDNPCVDDCVPRSLLTRESIVVVTIKANRKRYNVLFEPNRFNDKDEATTAATNAWPRGLKLPRVGKPVTYEVVGVSYV